MDINKKDPLLLVIRHAPTAWNEQGLYQGRMDIDLLESSIKSLRENVISQNYVQWKVFSSPMKRTLQTACLLYPHLSEKEITVVPEAVELNFGDWEGKSIQDIQKNLSPSPFEFEWRGLDDKAPNGESHREAQIRVKKWLKEFHAKGENGVLITHKGLILNMLAAAWRWEMETKRPKKVDYQKAQLFEVLHDGSINLVGLNLDYLK